MYGFASRVSVSFFLTNPVCYFRPCTAAWPVGNRYAADTKVLSVTDATPLDQVMRTTQRVMNRAELVDFDDKQRQQAPQFLAAGDERSGTGAGRNTANATTGRNGQDIVWYPSFSTITNATDPSRNRANDETGDTYAAWDGHGANAFGHMSTVRPTDADGGGDSGGSTGQEPAGRTEGGNGDSARVSPATVVAFAVLAIAVALVVAFVWHRRVKAQEGKITRYMSSNPVTNSGAEPPRPPSPPTGVCIAETALQQQEPPASKADSLAATPAGDRWEVCEGGGDEVPGARCVVTLRRNAGGLDNEAYDAAHARAHTYTM